MSKHNYVIGPKSYDIYIAVLKVGLSIGAAVGFAINAGLNIFNDTGLVTALWNAFWQTLIVLFHVVFWTTLTFFVLERLGVNVKKGMTEEVDKAMKQAMKPLKSASLNIPAHEIWLSALCGAALMLAPLYVNMLGLRGPGLFTPLINPDLVDQLSGLLAIFGAAILILALLQYASRKWTVQLAYLNFVIVAVASILAVFAFMNLPVINEDFVETIVRNSDNSLNSVANTTMWTNLTIGISVAVGSLYALYEAYVIVGRTQKK